MQVGFGKMRFIKWCRSVVASEDYVIVDTETTSLCGEICDLAIIDIKGKELYNSLLRPSCVIEDGATAIHHISNKMVVNAPTIADEWVKILGIVGTRTVITYNVDFDCERLNQSLEAYDMQERITWPMACAMTRYADFWDAPPRWSGANAPWQKLENACYQQGIMLPPGLHRAMPDCNATLALIRKVAMTGENSPTYHTKEGNGATNT